MTRCNPCKVRETIDFLDSTITWYGDSSYRHSEEIFLTAVIGKRFSILRRCQFRITTYH